MTTSNGSKERSERRLFEVPQRRMVDATEENVRAVIKEAAKGQDALRTLRMIAKAARREYSKRGLRVYRAGRVSSEGVISSVRRGQVDAVTLGEFSWYPIPANASEELEVARQVLVQAFITARAILEGRFHEALVPYGRACALVMRLDVLPLKPYFFAGVGPMKGIKKAAERAHGSPEEVEAKRSEYVAAYDKLRQERPSISRWKTCVIIGAKFGVSYKTIERATESGDPS